QRARQVCVEDFSDFDYVLAMDRNNLQELHGICPPEPKTRPDLFLKFAQQSREHEVPDPYYGGDQGFEQVLDLVEDASRGLLAAIREKHNL
ncbi:MAG: low molecular weight protein-tyrosine phosphatase, partial [Pseudomonadota bacterium]|nr:low molecular weight protein-tyrosine phosphatase [Pseudomonadota bacterium]